MVDTLVERGEFAIRRPMMLAHPRRTRSADPV